MMQCLANPLCLFLLVWGGAAGLYLGGAWRGMFPAPSTLTLALVLLNIVTFSLGYLTWTLFRGLDAGAELPPIAPARPLTQKAMARAMKFTLLMGVAVLALEAYRVVVIARHFQTTWSDLATQPELFRIRMVAFIQDTLLQTSGTVMLLSVTSSLFSIGFVLLGVMLHVDATKRKYVYLLAHLAILLMIGLIHLSRYEVTSNILYTVFAYCFTASLDRPDARISAAERSRSGRRLSQRWFRMSHLKLVVPLATIVLLFVLIDMLLDKSSEYGLGSRLQGILFHFYWYLAGPLAAFNEFVTTFVGDLQWGRSMFLPAYKWLCRFHLVQAVEINYYGEKVLVPYMSNVYTYLRNFYEDFGILGVAIVPYLLGWAIAAVRVQARRCFSFLNLYLVLLLFLFFSFYNYFLSSNQIYLQILFGFLLFRYQIPDGQQASMLRRYQDSST